MCSRWAPGSLRKLCATLPVNYVSATAPDVAFRDLNKLISNGHEGHVSVRVENTADGATVRLYSMGEVPSLSRILPALQSAGVAIDREQTYAITMADGSKRFVTSLAVDAESAAKLAKPGITAVAEELFPALFND